MSRNYLSQSISPSCLTRIIHFASPKDFSSSSSTSDNDEQQFIRRFKRFFQLCSRVTSSWQTKIDEAFANHRQEEPKSFVQKFFGKTDSKKVEVNSVLFRKIFEMIALNPLNFTRTNIFRRQVLQIFLSNSNSLSNQDEEEEEKLFQRLKLPLQVRQTSLNGKHGALAVGKDVLIYRLPNRQVVKNSTSLLSMDFKELGSVKPRAASSPTTNNFSELQSRDQPQETSNSTAKLFCAYRSCFSPDSRLLAVSCLDGTIRFGESKTGQLRATLSILNGKNETSSNCETSKAQSFFIEALCFSQDNRYLYFCANTTVYVAKVFDHEGYLEPIIVNSWKGFSIAAPSSVTHDHTQYTDSGLTFYINNMRLHQNFLVTCCGDVCAISVYDVSNENCENPKFLKRIGTSSVVAAVDKNETWVRDIAILNNNHHSSSSSTSFFTVTNDRMLACYEVNEENRNGSSVTTFRESRSRTPFFTNHTSKIFAIAIADPEGRQENNILATASNDGDVRIFDIENWKEKKEMILKGDGVGLLTCLAFTPSLHQNNATSKTKKQDPRNNGSANVFYLVTGSHLNEAKIWSLSPSRNESQCFKIVSFKSSVLSVAMSPNGENLVFTDYYGARRFFAVVVSESVNNNNNRRGKTTKQFEGVSKYPVIRMQFVKNTIRREINDDDDDDEKLFIEDLMGNTFLL